MVIFVLNCGSSSLKYRLVKMPEEEILSYGKISKSDSGNSVFELIFGKKKIHKHINGYCIAEILSELLNEIINPENHCLVLMSEIDAVGHRLIHGKDKVCNCKLIDSELILFMEENMLLAPLHYPSNIEGIKAALSYLPEAVHAGVFDTAFHSTLPSKAFLYGLPIELYEKYKIRRYGFHGISHKYVSQIACRMSRLNYLDSKIITCHLGSGASVTAIKNGISIDTSMGFTPSEGLIMGTRCGDLDTGVVLFLQKKMGISAEEMENILNKESGLLGLSGVSSDFTKLTEFARIGNLPATLALDIFAYRVKKYIGSYAAVLGGLDILVFTGGIGENSSLIREKICEGLEFLGIQICEKLNSNCIENELIQDINSVTKIAVVKTNEEIAIAKEIFDYLN